MLSSAHITPADLSPWHALILITWLHVAISKATLEIANQTKAAKLADSRKNKKRFKLKAMDLPIDWSHELIKSKFQLINHST